MTNPRSRPERVHIPLDDAEVSELDGYAVAAGTTRAEAARRLIKAGLGHDIGPDHAVALRRHERLKALNEELPLPSRPASRRRRDGTQPQGATARQATSPQRSEMPDRPPGEAD